MNSTVLKHGVKKDSAGVSMLERNVIAIDVCCG